VLLSGARRSDDPARLDAALDQAVEMITHGIANLRALITDLRPAALDSLGAEPALRALASRVEAQAGVSIELDARLAYEQGRIDRRHVPELEAVIYRLVQEALTNVVKHADASTVRIEVVDSDDDVRVDVEVRDDGRGFDPKQMNDGFGLLGMRERVGLVNGTLDVRSELGEGTTVRARIPIQRRDAELALASRVD
jgi:signal transduction histidine kinase